MKFKNQVYPVSELDAFYNYCVNEINLKINRFNGNIPPIDQNVEKYFKSLNELNKSLALENLSMGMSADYMEAIKHGSTFVRLVVLFLVHDLNFSIFINLF